MESALFLSQFVQFFVPFGIGQSQQRDFVPEPCKHEGNMRGLFDPIMECGEEENLFEKFDSRNAGRYISRAEIPADTFNEGRYTIGVNASSFGVRRYFMDESALSFSVDISGAPGTQWPEVRQGPVRPRLDWKIEKLD